MIRRIASFHCDTGGDWVADLNCLHTQHVRHRPPFLERAWVLVPEERDQRIGSPMDCPLCDRAELPHGLRLARRAGPFDHTTLPAGLQRAHLVAPGTWGRLCVEEGSVTFHLPPEADPGALIPAGASQPIPPGVPHRLGLVGAVRLSVEFLVPGTTVDHAGKND